MICMQGELEMKEILMGVCVCGLQYTCCPLVDKQQHSRLLLKAIQSLVGEHCEAFVSVGTIINGH